MNATETISNTEEKKEIETLPIEEKQFEVEINLSSTDVKKIESVCENFFNYARISIPDLKGVKRHPTRKGVITTRKSPCGEGTNTYDRFRMSVHMRSFNMIVVPSMLDKFASFLKSTNVEINLVIKE